MSKWTDPIHALFNNPKGRKLFVHLRIPLTIGLVGALIHFQLLDRNMLIPGFLVSLLGEGIQLWCFASLKKQKILASRGPYVLVRNPMYMGRYLIILGVLLLLKNSLKLPVVAAFTVIYYFYMVNRVKREEAKLKDIFGDDYTAYCRKTHRFLPSFRDRDLAALFFWDWTLLRQNHGPWNLIGLLGGYGILWFFM